MPLVTVDDLKVYMDRGKLEQRQVLAASLIIDGLVSEMESILRRPIEVHDYVESYVVPKNFVWQVTTEQGVTYPYFLSIRNSPIISVAALSVNGELKTEGSHYVVRRWGIDLYDVTEGDEVIVNYTAGLDGPNIPHLKLLILRAASREMQNMTDDVVGIKDMETRNSGPAYTGFLQEEIQSIRKYRRIRIV